MGVWCCVHEIWGTGIIRFCVYMWRFVTLCFCVCVCAYIFISIHYIYE